MSNEQQDSTAAEASTSEAQTPGTTQPGPDTGDLPSFPATPIQEFPPQPQAPTPQAAQQFPDLDLDFNLSPRVSCHVRIASRDGQGWTLPEYKRLLAFLELQRAFLADEPLDVSVRVFSPRPVAALNAPQAVLNNRDDLEQQGH